MKLLFRCVLFGFIFIGLNFASTSLLYSQTKSMRKIERQSKRSQSLLNQRKSKKVQKAEKKAEAVKEKQKDEYNKKRKDVLDRRNEIQTPATRERMKESRKQAENWNKQKRTPFFKRIFRRKPK
jgi:biopolymer transport protein ExbB/TolQ